MRRTTRAPRSTFATPAPEVPGHTVFSLENTGGKTSFLSLVLSCFDTHERRFLKDVDPPQPEVRATTSETYRPSSWSSGISPAVKESFLEPGPPRHRSSRREARRRPATRDRGTFRSAPGLDRIPAPGLLHVSKRSGPSTFDSHPELRRPRPRGNFRRLRIRRRLNVGRIARETRCSGTALAPRDAVSLRLWPSHHRPANFQCRDFDSRDTRGGQGAGRDTPAAAGSASSLPRKGSTHALLAAVQVDQRASTAARAEVGGPSRTAADSG